VTVRDIIAEICDHRGARRARHQNWRKAGTGYTLGLAAMSKRSGKSCLTDERIYLDDDPRTNKLVT